MGGENLLSLLVAGGLKGRKTEKQSCGKPNYPLPEENAALATPLQASALLQQSLLEWQRTGGQGSSYWFSENKCLGTRDQKSPSNTGQTAEMSEMGHWESQQSKSQSWIFFFLRDHSQPAMANKPIGN